MSLDRLRRVTDLFVEGTEYLAGEDAAGPVVLWINKLNSFQAAEAQKDGIGRRYIALAQLKESGEYAGMLAEIEMTAHDRLAADWVEMNGTEIYLAAMNDLDLESELREEREALERVEDLQDDAGVADDAPERAVGLAFKQNWLSKFQDLQTAKQAEWLRDAKEMAPAELQEKFLEKWREMRTHAEYEREHRATQLFFAVRRCEATRVESGWDHRGCDHNQRWMKDRKEVQELPEALLANLQDTLESVTVPTRAAGNSDAPANSSESSELSSAPEAVSNPSSPEETRPAAQSI